MVITNTSNSITYVSNAGVLIHINNRKILIDGLCTSKMPIYKSTPEEISEKLIEGIPPYDNIHIMLITHKHSDHFDPNLVCRFLEKNSDTVVISTDDVISNIKSMMPNRTNNLIELNPSNHSMEKINIKEVEIRAISMIHEGEDYAQVSNLAFLIDYGYKLLHLGDAAPVKENFESLDLNHYKIDILMANFPYVSIPKAREIIKNYVHTEIILAIHLPYKELDKFRWIDVAKRSYERNKDSFIETVFMEELGESIRI